MLNSVILVFSQGTSRKIYLQSTLCLMNLVLKSLDPVGRALRQEILSVKLLWNPLSLLMDVHCCRGRVPKRHRQVHATGSGRRRCPGTLHGLRMASGPSGDTGDLGELGAFSPGKRAKRTARRMLELGGGFRYLSCSTCTWDDCVNPLTHIFQLS